MRRTQIGRCSITALTNLALRAGASLAFVIGAVAGPVQAQPTSASDASPPAAPKEASKRGPVISTTPGPFTYDAVGATPKVRKPAKPGATSPTAAKAKRLPKAPAAGTTTNDQPLRTGSR